MLFPNGTSVQLLAEADLVWIRTSGQTEGKTFDFKRVINVGDDRAKNEFAADVISFANTNGGFLILGADEDEGRLTDLIGLPGQSVDELKLQLEGIIRDRIEPRIDGVEMVAVSLGNTLQTLVVAVPRSWNPPHMGKQTGRFFMRNSAGKYILDCGQIRSSVIKEASLRNTIQQWRNERISIVAAFDRTIVSVQPSKLADDDTCIDGGSRRLYDGYPTPTTNGINAPNKSKRSAA